MTNSSEALSVIRIFDQIRSKISKINTLPLVPGSIKINSDEFRKIGNDEVETGIPFARISIDFPESNKDFTFCLDFFNTGLVLTILNFESLWCGYSELGKSDEKVATLITNILICLANGQLALLVTLTEDDDRLQAFELLYRKPGRKIYDAISTANAFQSERKLKDREYKTDVYVNGADIEAVSLDINNAQPLLMADLNFELMSKIGRKNIVGLHEPLTLEIFNANVDQYSQKVGEEVAGRVGQKFDVFDKKLEGIERKMGVSTMSLSQQIVHFAKWRHIELMFWSLLLLLCGYIARWDFSGLNPSIFLLTVVLVPIFVSRNSFSYPRILYVLAPFAYTILF